MRTRKWQDQSGQDRYTTEIVAREMQMLGGNSASQPAAQNSQPQQSATNPAPAGADQFMMTTSHFDGHLSIKL